MSEALNSIVPSLPWIVNLLQFGIMAFIILRLVEVLRETLGRAQGQPVAPQKPSVLPTIFQIPPVPPPAPVPTPPVFVPQSGPVPTSDEIEAIDDAFLEFLKKQEGFMPKAKWDYKQYTNGYGTKALSSTEVIDEATALQRLKIEAAAAEKSLQSFAPHLPKGAKQGLMDLTFNAGSGWEHQGLGTAVKAGDYEKAKVLLAEYCHAGGQVLEALVKRRAADIALFDHPL